MKDGKREQNPWDLIMAHNYEAGYNEYSRQLAIGVSDPILLANRGTAALCLGRIIQAREDFLLANALGESNTKHGRSSPYREMLFAIEWISGNPEQAIDHLQVAIEGIKTSRIEFTDAAGGVGVGALLYFASVWRRDPSLRAAATQFLEQLAANGRSDLWPGPIGLFLLDAVSFDGLLQATSSSGRVGSILKEAKKDLLVRRKMCQALFYNGVKKLEQNDLDESTRYLSDCSRLENPVLEVEWFLAGFELKKMKAE